MDFSEDEVKRAASLKLWINSRIGEIEAEAEKLRDFQGIVDIVLRTTSFKSASDIPTSQQVVNTNDTDAGEFTETRSLKRPNDNFLLGTAYISKSKIAIVPASTVMLNVNTPPFKSFFVNRILDGMKSKDNELIAQETIKSNEILNYDIEESNGVISKIIVTNYRDNTRLTEIINTVIWAFTRALEKNKN